MKLPREHGLLFIWISSLIYSIIMVKNFTYNSILALIFSLLILFSSDNILNSIRRCSYKEFLIYSLPLLIIFALISSNLYQKFFKQILGMIIISTIFLIIYKIRLPYYTIIGGTLISMHSYLLLMSSGIEIYDAYIFPILYALISTSQAYLRVRGHDYFVELLFLSTIALFLIFILKSESNLYIILFDILIRIYQYVYNINYKIGIRTYGIIEAMRNMVIFSLTGFILRS